MLENTLILCMLSLYVASALKLEQLSREHSHLQDSAYLEYTSKITVNDIQGQKQVFLNG